ncbi:MAG: polysaccharide deacetylase family protein [Vulcanimicrobiaceae bacterium]
MRAKSCTPIRVSVSDCVAGLLERPVFVIVALLVWLGTSAPGALAGTPARLSFERIREPTIRVLMFHQVTNHPIEPKTGVGAPWVTPQRFAALLAQLHQHGYHIIPLRTALNFFEGRLRAAALPHKSVLLTFDDGYRSAWTRATPLLRRYHAPATMFFEGHATGTMASRLNDTDLRNMAHSGIWTLESHGFAGHSDLVIGPHGKLSPYWYANLAWLPKLHRFETRAEFQARIENDLIRFRNTFQPIVGAPITVFAYPSGEYGQNARLRPGQNPQTRIHAGDSNAPGLKPEIFAALHGAGFEAAFSVYDPGHVHFAGRDDQLYALPRIGVSPSFTLATLRAIDTKGIEYPEITDGRYVDAGPLAVDGRGFLVASTDQPVLFRLNRYGRLLATYRFKRLAQGRTQSPSAISGLALAGHTLWLSQQAGWGPDPTPYLSRLRLRRGSLHLLSRSALPHTLDWLVGIAIIGKQMYGINDGGQLFTLPAGKHIASLVHATRYEEDRFAGLAASNGHLYTFDTMRHAILEFTTRGQTLALGHLHDHVRDLAVLGSKLFVSDWSEARRTVRIYTMHQEAP